MITPKLLYWAVIPLILLTAAACRDRRLPDATSTPATVATVTTLEAPKSIATTQLEAVQTSKATTTLETSQPTQTTTTSVQKTLSDLKAEKTSDGIRINLPENILFDFDKSQLRPQAKPTLAKVTTLLRSYKTAPVSIYGYTDSKGSDDYNQELSGRRANAVKDFLVQTFGVEAARLEAKGFGETQPVAPNAKPDGSDDPAGRQKNRRVEVIIRN